MRTVLSSSVLSPRVITLSGRVGLLAIVAALGACSNFNGLRSPVFTGSTASQPAMTGQAIAYAPSGGIHGADLPPPSGMQGTPAYASTPAPANASTSAPAYASAPQPYTPPAAYAANGLPMPVGQLASALAQAPKQLGAPPTTLGEQASRISGAGGSTHVVQSGDTAWNISQRYGVSVDQLIAANGGSPTVRLGQKIVIPGGSAQPKVQLASLNPQAVPLPAVAAPMPAVPLAAAVPAATPPAAAPSPAGQQVAVAPQTGAAAAPAPATLQPSAAASGFRWPVRGRVISGFGKKPDGERNDGINLAVPEGTAVKAAEDGTVIYAGNELKSYGNLVLIRHSNGWVSAYAHNSELQVKRGQEIRRGEIVALSGMSGGVTTPQVHFELRKEATPVDPLQHLTES
jgi:murein DD-endopeptidase MepM/ murein hydrolase activator NlpD